MITKKSETNVSSMRQILPQILAVSIKNILLIAWGTTLGFPTILIPALSDPDSNDIFLSQDAISWIASINQICVPLGCLLSGPITHTIGRRRSMQLLTAPFLASWLLFYYSKVEWQILLALSITGITGGLLESPVLTYVAEITQPHLRGMLGSTSAMSVSLGSLIEFLLGTFLQWRVAALVNCVIPLTAFVLLAFIPESPIFLISKNRLGEAQKSIAWLRGWSTIEDTKGEYNELYTQMKSGEGSKEFSKLEQMKLLMKKNFLWPFFVVSTMFLLNSFNGNLEVQTFAVKIFSAFRTNINPYYATALVGLFQLIGCIACIVLIHIVGKRIISFISLLGASLCLALTATYAYIQKVNYLDSNLNNSLEDDLTWIPTSLVIASSFLSYMGIRVIPWVLIGEVFSNETRATAAGLASGISYVFNFVSNKCFLNLVTTVTLPGVFWLYSAIGLLGTIITYFMLPETEGKSLYEITEHFAGRSKLKKSVRRKKNVQKWEVNAGFEHTENNHTESRL